MQTEDQFCPLCGTPLACAEGSPGFDCPRNPYPDRTTAVTRYNFIKRLLLFLTLAGCGISILVNFLAVPGFLWSLIVLASALYCWAVVPPLLRRGTNFGAQAVLQVVLTGFLVVALDFLIGYNGWSVTYVVPGLLCAGTLAILLMVVFNRTRWAQVVLYQIIIGFFGFVPLGLYYLDIAQNLIIVLISAGLSIASIALILAFGDRSVKNEFKRRFHV